MSLTRRNLQVDSIQFGLELVATWVVKGEIVILSHRSVFNRLLSPAALEPLARHHWNMLYHFSLVIDDGTGNARWSEEFTSVHWNCPVSGICIRLRSNRAFSYPRLDWWMNLTALELLGGQWNSLDCPENAPPMEYTSDSRLIEHLVVQAWIGDWIQLHWNCSAVSGIHFIALKLPCQWNTPVHST